MFYVSWIWIFPVQTAADIGLNQTHISPAAKTHFGGEPVFVRYSFF